MADGAGVDGAGRFLTELGSGGGPVFVLCGGRSGSTLLRFVLDAHPDLACPPESDLPALCRHLSSVWSLLAGGVPGVGVEPADLPAVAVAGARAAADALVGVYLARRGRRRYCDKTLGAAWQAGLLARIWPEARFVCLYRHPMDVIASGAEACSWGLSGYGFEPYAAGAAGNTALALARYWADHAEAILRAEQQLAGCCLRVRYEDLVADPEGVAGRIFGFLGVAPAPGITSRLFSLDRERLGPSDYKIWSTAGVTGRSVGRGWRVPAQLIGAAQLERVNELAGRLGYIRVDGQWGAGAAPADVRADVGEPGPALAGDGAGAGGAAVVPLGLRLLAQRVMAGVGRLDEEFARRWAPYSAEPFLLAATVADERGLARWLVDPVAGRAVVGEAARGGGSWSVTGTARGWERVLGGQENMGVAFRHGDLRYRDAGGPGPGSAAADARVSMMAELLAIAAWRPAGADGQRGQPAGAGAPAGGLAS
ncbi:MAG TPA: sulfotransferase [Streptosporangiaceae bacterium]